MVILTFIIIFSIGNQIIFSKFDDSLLKSSIFCILWGLLVLLAYAIVYTFLSGGFENGY